MHTVEKYCAEILCHSFPLSTAQAPAISFGRPKLKEERTAFLWDLQMGHKYAFPDGLRNSLKSRTPYGVVSFAER